MSSRTNRADRARRLASGIRTTVGNEVRDARIGAGASLRVAGAAADMSHAQFGRIERGVLSHVTVDQLARACAAVGLRLAVRAFPDGPPVRDAAHLALLRRFRACLPGTLSCRAEVPIPIPGDPRAWDLALTAEDRSDQRLVGVEAETRLHDVQALDRRVALKRRDAGIEVVVLLVNDTAWNRRILRAYREELREGFPANGREVLRHLRAGSLPARSGIVLL